MTIISSTKATMLAAIIVFTSSFYLASCGDRNNVFPFDIPLFSKCEGGDTISIIVQPLGTQCVATYRYFQKLDSLPSSCELVVVYASDGPFEINTENSTLSLQEYSMWTDNYNKTMLYTVDLGSKIVITEDILEFNELRSFLE